ncbi:MAG: hypothetical protein JJE25_00775 [Bacteroidia bacterium]|nr:hypothetical protein [Bacteroidia bacterium]
MLYFLTNVSGANKYSISNGNWTTGTTWSNSNGGTTCNCIPSSSDYITITYAVTLNTNLTSGSGISGTLDIMASGALNGGSTYSVDIKAGGTLLVSGSLVLKDLTFFNGSIVNVSGSITVNGNFENKNNSNSVTINGSMTVYGSFITGNGSVINGTGSISIPNGPVTNTGTVFGITGTNPCPSLPCVVIPALPVELISFKAQPLLNSVRLIWSTASEINNNYFLIERSADLESVKEISFVSGAGNCSVQMNYSEADENPLEGISYYRLKQVDFDGQYSHSRWVKINFSRRKGLKIIPNPLKGNKLNVILPQIPIASCRISVQDMTGKNIYYRKLAKDLSDEHITFDDVTLNSDGIFFVTLEIDGVIYREKFSSMRE